MKNNKITENTSATRFIEDWTGKGDEKQHTQSFWLALLRDVLNVSMPEKVIDFEKRVKIDGTKYIDGYIGETRVAIEQKGVKIDLDKPEKQSDGTLLTPYGQAKRYNDNLPYSERCRWIVVCNFAEFRIYDMDKPDPEKHVETLRLCDLPKEAYRLQFLIDQKNENIRREEEISIKAGKLVDKLYEALLPQYKSLNEKSLRSLNILCVRIVFCLYAEDAGLFATRTAFEDYIRSFSLTNVRKGLMELFKALDTRIEDRDAYDESQKPFPYVNGGLFKDENIEIPNFTQEIVDVICNHCAPFNWSAISPTIFGAVFESTLNPETRRKGGMHYTSIQNIHKVINPLFMDDLIAEFEHICTTKATKQKNEKLHDFQAKLGSLKFLDPACGSGNFLTETYLSLRRLENEVISILNKGEAVLGFDEFIKVKIDQFYGIEINDFAVTVAKTALWIAESQMMAETEKILGMNLDFLPLKTNANIVEGNALRMDWMTLADEPQPDYFVADKLNVYMVHDNTPFEYGGQHFKELNVIAREVEERELPSAKKITVIYDYIIGNPPFIGARWMDKSQKEDVILTFGKDWQGVGDLDYVCCWYKKASDVICGTDTRCAFVSTNSITQGGTVSTLWKPLFADGIHIDFAWRTFKWENETADKANMAAVHCVIVGFSVADNPKPKVIFLNDKEKAVATNINGYLLDAPNIFVEKRKSPLCDVPRINKGSQPTDGGNLILESEEYDDFIKKEPAAKNYVRQFVGSVEFINGIKRYCLWLVNASPAELRKMPLVVKRVEAVKAMRLESPKAATRNWAAYPYLFTENRQPQSGNYLLIPSVSSERREYVPIGFLDSSIVASNLVLVIPNATLYEFGILTSSVHNAWMRVVCGRLKSDYRYSGDIVYNNFPWPSGSVDGDVRTPNNIRTSIERTAQAILDARSKYPDSTLADLYDSTFMPPELRRAHKANDEAVLAAYGWPKDLPESEIVARLFALYELQVKG